MKEQNVDLPPTLLSLFSGIAGLDIAASNTFGAVPVGYVERSSYAASVLLARMEEQALDPAPVYIGDIRDLDARPLEGVTVLTAGYPCQPFSNAGLRRGEEDERHLWPEVLRIIRQVRPQLVILENVANHLRLGFDTVLRDLHLIGFSAEWEVVSASDVGAPHLRKRLFVVACAHSKREGLQGLLSGRRFQESRRAFKARWGRWWSAEPSVGRVAYGVPSRLERNARLHALGNAVCPAQAEWAIIHLTERLMDQKGTA